MNRWLESMVAIRDDLYEIMSDPMRWDNELPARLKKLMERARGSGYVELEEGSGRPWTLGRFWVEAPADFDEFNVNDPVVRWFDKVFSDEYHWMKPISIWWWDTGMLVGTRYASGADGEAGDIDLSVPPLWPFDWDKIAKKLPDLILYEIDENGIPVEPPTIYKGIHDIEPDMVTSGQHALSRGRRHLKRRCRQETTNQKLDAQSAFGVPAWTPAQSENRPQSKRRRSI